jgi:hypothetical protein
MRRKEDIVIIGFGFILLIIMFVLVYISLQPKQHSKETTTTTTTTVSASDMPSPTAAALNGKPPFLYDEKQEDKLLGYIQKRRPLTDADRVAKANILAAIPSGQGYGVLAESKDIRIDYTASADIFQVEIMTTNFQAAKNEANLWFRARGISQKAICTMPVEFYMSFDVANAIRQTNMIFDPLGNGC